MKLIDAPVGLFLSKEGELCMKTEYIADWGVEAYIVRSGETYWGGAKTTKERNNLDVTPVDAVPVVRCRECKHHRDKNEQEQQYLVEDILICTSPDATDDCWNAVWPDHFCSYGERKEGAD